MASTNNHGTICWLEIPVLSAARASAFYTAIFGWECDTPSPSSAYPTGLPSPLDGSPATIHMFRKGGTLHGAFIQVPEGCLIRAWEADSPGKMAVLTTFAVESIEEVAAKVAEMGGRMHLPKTAIGGDRGYFARFIDCEGNLQGIWAQN